MFSVAAATFGVRRLDAAFFQTADATAVCPSKRNALLNLVNCLDIFGALRVKGVYTPEAEAR